MNSGRLASNLEKSLGVSPISFSVASIHSSTTLEMLPYKHFLPHQRRYLVQFAHPNHAFGSIPSSCIEVPFGV